MSESEKVALCQALINDVNVTQEQISTYLALCASRILERLYPFGGAPDTLPDQYAYTQCELAVRMIARRGGEGEASHSENGISRTYGSVDDEDILQRLTSYAGVI